MKLAEYLKQRRTIVEKEYLDSNTLAYLREGHKLIAKGIIAHCDEVTPDVTDKVQILEGMMFGFIQNCFDHKMLSQVQKEVVGAVKV